MDIVYKEIMTTSSRFIDKYVRFDFTLQGTPWLVLLSLPHRGWGCTLFWLSSGLPWDLFEGTNIRRKWILLCHLQNATESSRISEQKRTEGFECSAQALCQEAARENARSSLGTWPATGRTTIENNFMIGNRSYKTFSSFSDFRC